MSVCVYGSVEESICDHVLLSVLAPIHTSFSHIVLSCLLCLAGRRYSGCSCALLVHVRFLSSSTPSEALFLGVFIN